jgi:hypothetical protein
MEILFNNSKNPQYRGWQVSEEYHESDTSYLELKQLRKDIAGYKRKTTGYQKRSMLGVILNRAISYAGPEIEERIKTLPRDWDRAVDIIESWLPELPAIRERALKEVKL